MAAYQFATDDSRDSLSAEGDQVAQCYPQMARFLALKRQFDPGELFQSTWYRHYRTMFGE
jgi:hypothetical protein